MRVGINGMGRIGRLALRAAFGAAERPADDWRRDFIGQPLKARLSPLLDPFLVARYEDAADESLRLGLIKKRPEIKSWFDRRFVDQAVNQLVQASYWPAYGADGKLITSTAAHAAPAAAATKR